LSEAKPEPASEETLTSVKPINVGPLPKPPKSAQGLMTAAVRQEFSGPMPPPSLLRHYEEICPGSADRMLRMAEQEAEHRRKTESAIVNAQIEHFNKQFSESRRGQICALIITLAALAGGVYSAIQGHEIAGSIIGVGGIGGIVTTLILGRRSDIPSEGEASQETPKNNEPTKNRKKRRK
jgi:uncharacterized membrane protein